MSNKIKIGVLVLFAAVLIAAGTFKHVLAQSPTTVPVNQTVGKTDKVDTNIDQNDVTDQKDQTANKQNEKVEINNENEAD